MREIWVSIEGAMTVGEIGLEWGSVGSYVIG